MTVVTFRVAVVAIFPELLYSRSNDDVMSYEHAGQHGAASWPWIRFDTRPAKPEEYATLLAELIAIGYVPDVRAKLDRSCGRSPRKVNS